MHGCLQYGLHRSPASALLSPRPPSPLQAIAPYTYRAPCTSRAQTEPAPRAPPTQAWPLWAPGPGPLQLLLSAGVVHQSLQWRHSSGWVQPMVSRPLLVAHNPQLSLAETTWALGPPPGRPCHHHPIHGFNNGHCNGTVNWGR